MQDKLAPERNGDESAEDGDDQDPRAGIDEVGSTNCALAGRPSHGPKSAPDDDASQRQEPASLPVRMVWLRRRCRRRRLLIMQKFAALLLTITGTSAGVLGLVLFWVLRRSGVWADPDSRVMWRGMSGMGTTFDSSVLRTSQARKAMSDLWKDNPRVAAKAAEDLRQFDELEASKPDAFKEVRRISRFMSLTVYLIPALVVLGAVAAAAGLAWLRSF